MSALKDPAIKLFGKTITLSNNEAALHRHRHRHRHEQPSCSTSQDNKFQNNSGGEGTRGRLADDIINLSDEESIEPSLQSEACETPKTPNADTETLTTKEEQSDQTNTSHEKGLKKPDKIIPCPRCNSMETKFCYYNNYNVNQPRHFCKKCQRYWTAGGTMRNVPVGSGRRKNKSTCALSYRHIMASDTLQADAANGSVLMFGSERPVCESIETSSKDHSNGCNGGFSLQVPSFPGAAWPWSPPVTPHTFSPSGFPMAFYPSSPYWGCAVPNPWNVPWLSPQTPTNQSAVSITPTSPTLGKHYRDGSMLNSSNARKIESREENDAERSVLLPTRLFKAFLPKADERIQVDDTSLVMQANPAAFSRSTKFQEST